MIRPENGYFDFRTLSKPAWASGYKWTKARDKKIPAEKALQWLINEKF